MDCRPQSPWREFAFMLHQLQHCIQPKLNLSHSLTNWGRLTRQLSESPRERKTQAQIYPNTTELALMGLKPRAESYRPFGTGRLGA